MRCTILWLAILFFGVPAVAADSGLSALEKIFEDGRYPQFFKIATPLAENGNAEAQFLLGKAYDLGKGVEADVEQARTLYALAAEQSHARAANNLGLILLHHDAQPRRALAQFERAQALGLHSPSHRNALDARMALCTRETEHDMCTAAGDAYVSAWQTDRDKQMLDAAVNAYGTACFIARQWVKKYGVKSYAARSAIDCQRAKELAEAGAALGLARATYNRGAIAYDERRYEEAIKWFSLADERGLGLAAYTLGEMHEKGHGVAKNATEAIAWFKRGASLKEKLAVERMVGYWEAEISRTYDAARIKTAMGELATLQPSAARSDEGLYRLELLATLRRNAASFPALSKAQLQAHFCPDKVEVPWNTEWRIFAVNRPDDVIEHVDSLRLLANGRADEKGCVTLSVAGLEKLRLAMARGETPMLVLPGHRSLLTLERSAKAKGTTAFSMGAAIQ